MRQPPMCPARDQTWWLANVSSENADYRVYLWVEGSGAGVDDEWVRGELEKLALKNTPIGKLYSFSPYQLNPHDRAAAA